MGGIGQIFLLCVTIVLSNGTPHFLHNRYSIYNGLYGMPYLCSNQYNLNLGQLFMCNYYYGLRNSPGFNIGYRYKPVPYHRYSDDSNEYNEDTSRESYDVKDNNGFNIIHHDSKNLKQIDNDFQKGKSSNGYDIPDLNVKDKNIDSLSSDIKNSDFIYDIDLEKNAVDKTTWAKKQNTVNIVKNNQAVDSNSNGVFTVPNVDFNRNVADGLPNKYNPGNGYNPIYFANNVIPSQINDDSSQNLDSKQPNYYGVPLNSGPIIVIPNEEGQTILSNTKQILVLGNGKNIPLTENQLFILNNDQGLLTNNDKNSKSDKNNNESQGNEQNRSTNKNKNVPPVSDQNILQGHIKILSQNNNQQNLPQNTDLLAKINPNIPITNSPLLPDNSVNVPLVPDIITLSSDQRISQEIQRIPQETDEDVSQDNDQKLTDVKENVLQVDQQDKPQDKIQNMQI